MSCSLRNKQELMLYLRVVKELRILHNSGCKLAYITDNLALAHKKNFFRNSVSSKHVFQLYLICSSQCHFSVYSVTKCQNLLNSSFSIFFFHPVSRVCQVFCIVFTFILCSVLIISLRYISIPLNTILTFPDLNDPFYICKTSHFL